MAVTLWRIQIPEGIFCLAQPGGHSDIGVPDTDTLLAG